MYIGDDRSCNGFYADNNILGGAGGGGREEGCVKDADEIESCQKRTYKVRCEIGWRISTIIVLTAIFDMTSGANLIRADFLPSKWWRTVKKAVQRLRSKIHNGASAAEQWSSSFTEKNFLGSTSSQYEDHGHISKKRKSTERHNALNFVSCTTNSDVLKKFESRTV